MNIQQAQKVLQEAIHKAHIERNRKMVIRVVAVIGMVFAAAFAVQLLTGCTTTQYVTKPVETKLDLKGQVNEGKIGINKDGQAILQREVAADDELRVQTAVNQSLYRDMMNSWYDLKTCKELTADPKMGGHGVITELPDVSDMNATATTDAKEELGLDQDGNLRVVQKSYFVERLNAERKYDKTLRTMIKTFSRQAEKCELELRYSQSRHQLGTATVQVTP